jgi:hypothetical protein
MSSDYAFMFVVAIEIISYTFAISITANDAASIFHDYNHNHYYYDHHEDPAVLWFWPRGSAYRVRAGQSAK